MKWLDTLARILNGVMNAINRSNKKDAAANAADNIANNDDGVLKSSKTFDELAAESKRDKPE